MLGMPRGRHVFGTVRIGEKGQIVSPKGARELFGIRPGDTLLVLGDEETGIIVTRPDVVNDAAMRVFTTFDREKQSDE